MPDDNPQRRLGRIIGERLAAEMVEAARIKGTGAAVKRSGRGAAGSQGGDRQGEICGGDH